jgi:hypothetical protein
VRNPRSEANQPIFDLINFQADWVVASLKITKTNTNTVIYEYWKSLFWCLRSVEFLNHNKLPLAVW